MYKLMFGYVLASIGGVILYLPIVDTQGAVLSFAGDQIKPAYTAFADFLAREHDHKGAQSGAITYNNGTVRHDGFHVKAIP
jgi:hypothetical protein